MKEEKAWNQCDYKGCKRKMVTDGNMVCDVQGNDYTVALCEVHLRKLVPDAVIKEG